MHEQPEGEHQRQLFDFPSRVSYQHRHRSPSVLFLFLHLHLFVLLFLSFSASPSVCAPFPFFPEGTRKGKREMSLMKMVPTSTMAGEQEEPTGKWMEQQNANCYRALRGHSHHLHI